LKGDRGNRKKRIYRGGLRKTAMKRKKKARWSKGTPGHHEERVRGKKKKGQVEGGEHPEDPKP